MGGGGGCGRGGGHLLWITVTVVSVRVCIGESRKYLVEWFYLRRLLRERRLYEACFVWR